MVIGVANLHLPFQTVKGGDWLIGQLGEDYLVDPLLIIFSISKKAYYYLDGEMKIVRKRSDVINTSGELDFMFPIISN